MEDSKVCTSVGAVFPLHPNLVGKLPELNKTLENVEDLILSHIKTQKTQEQEDIELIFAANKDLLTNPSSPWVDFTHRDIRARLSFLQSLLETLTLYQKTFAKLQSTFAFRWRLSACCRISAEGKTHLTELHNIWKDIEGALSIIAPDSGPYPLHLEIQCERHTQKLVSVLGTINLGDRGDAYSPEREWIELDMSQASISISQQPKDSNNQSRRDSSDVESGGPRDRGFWGRWRWLLIKEIQLIVLCLFIAILYSALKTDPQTGFEIAAFLFAVGTTSLTIFRMYLKQKETEAKIRLQ